MYLVSFTLMVAAFVGMSWYFGFGLEYRFEVTAISIGWLTLMPSGLLLALVFVGRRTIAEMGSVCLSQASSRKRALVR